MNNTLLREFSDIFSDQYECFSFFSNVPEKPTVLDIGANTGFFALFFFNVRPKASIFSFEPFPPNFEALKKNHEANANRDWKIFSNAVSSDSGELSIISKSKTSVSTDPGINNTGSFEFKVSSTSISNIVQDQNIQRIDFLKIDCEGSEFEILRSLNEEHFNRVLNIAVEVTQGYSEPEKVALVENLLKDQGFHTETRTKSPHALCLGRKSL